MEKSTVTPRPYRWGRFQGWTIFIISLATMSFSVLAGSLPGAVGALQGVFTGWGLIKKRRYGLVLFLANAALAGLAATVMTLYAVIHAVSTLTGHHGDWPSIAFACFGSALLSGWLIIPSWFYYRQRWSEFSQPEPRIQALTNRVSLVRDAARPAQTPTLLPDFGKHLAATGTPQESIFVYATWEMDMLQVVGLGRYCSTRVQPHEGALYCATFDFDDDVLCEILKAATRETLDAVTVSLIDDASGARNLLLPTPVNVGVAAVLGKLEQGLHDVFIPLIITEVFGGHKAARSGGRPIQ